MSTLPKKTHLWCAGLSVPLIVLNFKRSGDRMQSRLQIGIVAISVAASLMASTTASAQKRQQQQPQTPSDTMYRVQVMPTFAREAGEWESTQPPFLPPDYAYPRYLLPPGEEKYARLNAHRIKQDII